MTGRQAPNVVFRGPTLTQSGYGVHARQIASWLLKKEAAGQARVSFALTPWGDTPWIIDGAACGGLVEQVMKRSAPDPNGSGFDVSLQLQLPNEWSDTLAKKNIGITAAVETDRSPPEWRAACGRMQAVVVPSKHAKDNLESNGPLGCPVYTIPESFNASHEGAAVDPLGAGVAGFNLLVFGQLTGNNPHNDRKNTFNTLKWACEAFRDDPEAGIIIKTNAGRNSLIDRRIVANMLKQVLGEVRRGPYPRVHLVHGNMTAEEVAGLYRHKSVAALVSLTRGEGFGLPILEAAAAGLPVVATGWSGHMDFLRHGKFINVFYHLADVHPSRVDGRIFVKGARWAEAQEEDFKQKITKLRSSPNVPRQWARELRDRIVDIYSFDRVEAMYDALLADIT